MAKLPQTTANGAVISMSRSPQITLAVALLSVVGPLYGQSTKPILTAADYNKFETVGSEALSPNGQWYAWRISRPQAEGVLYYRRADRDETPQAIPLGNGPVFTPDSKYLAYTIGGAPTGGRGGAPAGGRGGAAGAGGAQPSNQQSQQKAELVMLGTVAKLTFDGVRSFSFSPDGKYLVLQGYAAEGAKGSPLRIVDIHGSNEMTFGDVIESRWNDAGTILAMTVPTGAGTDNALQLYNPATRQIRPLEFTGGNSHGLNWLADGNDLYFYRTVSAGSPNRTQNTLVIWRGLGGEGTRSVIDSSVIAKTDNTLELVDGSPVRWSPDNRQIVISLRTRATGQRGGTGAPGAAAGGAGRGGRGGQGGGQTGGRGSSTQAQGQTTPPTADSSATVQIWSTSDVTLFPAQRGGRGGAAGTRNVTAILDLASGLIRKVEGDDNSTPTLLTGWDYATEQSTEGYDWGKKFGRAYHDLSVINVNTGERTTPLVKVRFSWTSPAGKYLLSFDGKDFTTTEVSTGKRSVITRGIKGTFFNTGYDTPTDIMPAAGVAGWLPNDAGVLVYDDFDLWRIAPDGSSSERLTKGREAGTIYRVLRLGGTSGGRGGFGGGAAAQAIDLSQPVYFTLTGDRDVKSGFARRDPNGQVTTLLYGDKSYRSLRKADSAEVYIYRAEDRDDSPDVFVVKEDFKSPRQLTTTNTFLKDYAWTRSELINYQSEKGIPLKAILLYPANYNPARKYPMIVYTYERLSQDLHTFTIPSTSYYNQVVWTNNEYFVLLPDIVFRPREPGLSTIESVRPAVRAVTARGLVDPKRVGQVGHSWGGYEAAYLGVNGGDFLATTIAGAGIYDLISFAGQIHWSGGSAEQDHFETGQARMEVPFWEDPAAHRRNSPLENILNMKIPMLMAHGNKDGTVEFFQATEFWNLARRADKKAVLLVYDGEDHGFTKKANQQDYQQRILEWFGHYLKGEPAQKWITDGIAARDLPAEIKRVADEIKVNQSGNN